MNQNRKILTFYEFKILNLKDLFNILSICLYIKNNIIGKSSNSLNYLSFIFRKSLKFNINEYL